MTCINAKKIGKLNSTVDAAIRRTRGCISVIYFSFDIPATSPLH